MVKKKKASKEWKNKLIREKKKVPKSVNTWSDDKWLKVLQRYSE